MPVLALLTQHAKQSAVEAALDAAGYSVTTISNFDTDTLGSFTGEVARKGSQLDAAVAKAKLACQISGERYGLGSEGSFGPDPHVGLTAWACEILAWWDAQDEHLVYSVVQGPEANFDQTTAATLEAALAFAKSVGFEQHGIIVGKPGEHYFSKQCSNWCDFEKHVTVALEQGPVWLETDMRAHRNPTRMAMIQRCAVQLAQMLKTQCPACQSVGFGQVSPVLGAVCEACGEPTSAVKAKAITCSACGHVEQELVRSTVPPSRCDYCNP